MKIIASALLSLAHGLVAHHKWFGCWENNLCVQAENVERRIPFVKGRKSLRLEIFAKDLFVYFPEIDFEVSGDQLVSPKQRRDAYFYKMVDYRVLKLENLFELPYLLAESIDVDGLEDFYSVYVSPEFIKVLGVVLWPLHAEETDRVATMKLVGSICGPAQEEILRLSRLDSGLFARADDPKGFYGACKPGEWCVQVHVISRDSFEAEMAAVDKDGKISRLNSGIWPFSLDSESLELHKISWMQGYLVSLLQEMDISGDLLNRISGNKSKTLFYYKGLRFFGLDLAMQPSRMELSIPMTRETDSGVF